MSSASSFSVRAVYQNESTFSVRRFVRRLFVCLFSLIIVISVFSLRLLLWASCQLAPWACWPLILIVVTFASALTWWLLDSAGRGGAKFQHGGASLGASSSHLGCDMNM